MSKPLLIYLYCWITACLLAAMLIVRNARQLELFQRAYRNLLLQPWKVSTFLVATIGMAVIAPYSGDPTWDYYDSTFMCVLAYLTAPWVIGVLYKQLHGESSWTKVYIGLCLWMFTASWSYDLYMLIKEGSYPMTWLPNIFASSVLYVCAGLLWSLEWYEGRGVLFNFMQPDWPEPVAQSRPDKILWYALPVIIFVAALTAPFLI